MTIYLEDLVVGRKVETERHVVSAADIDAFCDLSGDRNPLHTDDEYAREAGFAGRIAHGLLVLSIAGGLGSEADDWAIGAYLEESRRLRRARPAGRRDPLRVPDRRGPPVAHQARSRHRHAPGRDPQPARRSRTGGDRRGDGRRPGRGVTRTDPQVERDLVELAHEFAASEIRPVAASFDETRGVPHRGRPKGRSGSVSRASTCPRRTAAVASIRCAPPAWSGRSSRGATRRSVARRQRIVLRRPARRARHRGAARRWIPPLCGDDPADDGARDHRARRGLRRRRDHDDGDAGRRRLPAERRQDVGERRAGGRYYLVYATVAPGTRAKGITSFVVEKGDEGFTLGKKLPKLGSRCYPTGGAVLRRLLRAGRPADRRGRAGVLRRDALVRPLARDARGQLDRDRPGRARVRGRVREAARGVRQEDPRVPGGELPARRREGGARPGAAD